MYQPKLISLLLVSVLTGPIWALTTSDPAVALSRQFDYIIVGGSSHEIYTAIAFSEFCITAGTAGLTLANRLTANPSVSVLVIEAGVTYVSCVLYSFVPPIN
jgi:hypothetical protein